MKVLYVNFGIGPQDGSKANPPASLLRACYFLPLQKHPRDISQYLFTVVGNLDMAVSLDTSDHDLVKEFNGQFWVENCMTIRGARHGNPMIITDKKPEKYRDRWVIYIAINNNGRFVETHVTNSHFPYQKPPFDIFCAEGKFPNLRSLEEVRWLDSGQSLEIIIGDSVWYIENNQGEITIEDQPCSYVNIELPPNTPKPPKEYHPEPTTATTTKPERRIVSFCRWVKRVFNRFLEGLSHTGGA